MFPDNFRGGRPSMKRLSVRLFAYLWRVSITLIAHYDVLGGRDQNYTSQHISTVRALSGLSWRLFFTVANQCEQNNDVRCGLRCFQRYWFHGVNDLCRTFGVRLCMMYEISPSVLGCRRTTRQPVQLFRNIPPRRHLSLCSNFAIFITFLPSAKATFDPLNWTPRSPHKDLVLITGKFPRPRHWLNCRTQTHEFRYGGMLYNIIYMKSPFLTN